MKILAPKIRNYLPFDAFEKDDALISSNGYILDEISHQDYDINSEFSLTREINHIEKMLKTLDLTYEAS